MIKRLAREKKEREKRLQAANKLNFERMAEQDAKIEAEILKAKEERMNQIRNAENRVYLQRVPFAQRSR